MIRAVGARPALLDPGRHDRDLARVSHLPQLVASCWVSDVAARHPESLRAAGPVFREWARLAGSDPGLWGEILDANAPAVLGEIERLETLLAGLRRRWESEDNCPLPVIGKGRRDRGNRTGAPRRRARPGRR
jgi:prephenate dehydrogenase